MLNERLGKYLLLEKLSENGPTETFLAKSSVADGLNKFFIIKKILRTSTAKIEIPSLSHSNILAVFDSGIDRGFLFSVMDYFESYSLAQVLLDFGAARCQLGIDQCLYIVRETAAALIYAHNYTAHGKIGTDAILIGLDGAVKVSDFDYVNEVKSESNSDLRTLGRLLSDLLGENRKARHELENLCTKALSDNDENSFKSANEFYREINRYLNTQYPEFSSPEFGDQLTKFYGVVAQEQRLKLREYANIDVPKTIQLIVPDIYENPEKSKVVARDRLTVTSLPEGFGEIPTKGASPSVTFENINRENPFNLEPRPPLRPPPRPTPMVKAEPEAEKPSHFSDMILLLTVGTLLTAICYAYNVTIRGYSKNMIESVKLSQAQGQPELPAWRAESGTRAGRKLAFVNIRIYGGPADTRIFVDGKELLEKSPVKMFPIFADQDTLISAHSAKNKRTDSKKIRMQAGQSTTLVLSLQPERN